MLNRVEIRGLRRPHHDIKSMVCQPGFSLFTGVFRVIILLEDHLLRSFAPILKAILELILKDTNIEVGIHIAIDFAGIPQSHPKQPHNITCPPPNLSVPSTSLSLRPSPFFFHTHFLPSDQMTLFQSSTVQCSWALAKSS